MASGTAQALVPGADYPRSLAEFMAMFPDEAACARFVERLRFIDGFAADPSEEPPGDADAVVTTGDYRYEALAEAAARAGPVMPF